MSYSNQRYQGYPYVNPIVIDAPSIRPEEASRWTDLPRRAISTTVTRPSGSGTRQTTNNVSSSSENRSQKSPGDDSEDEPVIYINLPEGNGSDVCQSIESSSTREPGYVQDTILYDPFENRRIAPKDEMPSSDTQPESSTSVSNLQRPNANVAGSSSSSSQSPYQRPQNLPSFMQKESNIYGGHDSDGYPLSPIPITEFPEPPPAYTEVNPTPTPARTPQEPQIPPEPPRTQVIIPVPDTGSPIGVISNDRKYLMCHHCGTRVHTLVIREIGFCTYILAVILFVLFPPLFCIVYFMDCFKNKNHYCPSCNKLIGYQLPLIRQEINLVSD